MKKVLLVKPLQFVLKKLSVRILRKFNPDIIGVTGSVGKTSTKDAIWEVLKTRFNTEKSRGSYNNQLGIPLTILGLASSSSVFVWGVNLVRAFSRSLFTKKYYDKLVLEMGADRTGDIRYLVSFARPNVAVVTAVAAAHLEFFKNLDVIEKEKSDLVKSLPKDGVAILNYDDPRVRKMAGMTSAKVLFFSACDKVDVWADKIESGINGVNFLLHYGSERSPVAMKVVGRHMVYSALAAAACGVVYGIDLVTIAKALSKYQPPKGRSNLIKGVKKSIIINDTYNANPESMKSAIVTLNDIAKDFPKSRKVVALGDMRELGDDSEIFHRQLGKSLRGCVDLVIAVGPMATYIYEEVKKFLPEASWYFADSSTASVAVSSLIADNDIILVKGSRGIEMEKIVEKITNY